MLWNDEHQMVLLKVESDPPSPEENQAVARKDSDAVDHLYLLESIEEAEKELHNDPSAARFLESFSVESSRVVQHLMAQQQFNTKYAKAILDDIWTVPETEIVDEERKLHEVSERVEKLTGFCKELDAYARKSTRVLKRLAKKADKRLGTSCYSSLVDLLGPFRNFPNSTIVVVLSDVHEALRSKRSKLDLQRTLKSAVAEDEEKAEWVAPASFVRSTAKYWIEDDKLNDVLLTSAKEAPLLVYGLKGRLSNDVDTTTALTKDILWDHHSTQISSIYFDSKKLDFYRQRLDRSEGAQLLRARWYGKQPFGDDLVFLELKTHHEKWNTMDSVKERVILQEKHMNWFLSTANGWVQQDSVEAIRAASPSMSEAEFEDAIDLLKRMKYLVSKYDLRPCVRLTYRRAAFQSPKSNSLRLTVDRFVAASDESKASDDQWCLPYETFEQSADVTLFPFSVFEVKLSGSETPDSIQELIDSGTVADAPKFSKFLSGVATFRANELTTLPYWARHPLFAPLFGLSKIERAPPRQASNLLKPMSDVRECSNTDTSSYTSASSVTQENSSFRCRKPQFSKALSFFSSRGERGPNKIAPMKRARVEPKSFFANERTFIQWISAALLLVTISVLLLDFQADNEYAQQTAKILVCCTVVMIVYAVFVYFRRVRMLRSGTPYGYVDHFGPVLLAAAILIGIFVLMAHVFNGSSNEDTPKSLKGSAFLREESGRCFKHNSSGLSPLNFEPSDAHVDASRTLLLVPSNTEIVAFPLPVLQSGGEMKPADTPPRRLVDIAGADLEALTMVGDIVYAVDESQRSGFASKSILYALQWTNGDMLRVVSSWTIPVGGSEGITFVPGPTVGGKGGLYIADNTEVGNEKVVVFELPGLLNSNTANRTELEPHHSLNSRQLHKGLKSLSKIGAMTFFEDILYLLYGNARVVRAWDLEKGVLLSEWKLPLTSDGSEKQWEGIALERIANKAPTRLGSPQFYPADIIVHLTLDTPLEVWSFEVQQGTSRGAIDFPACAEAR